MYLFDALFFFLVRPSFCPHGLVGWRPPELLPSPPPSGWSTGFIATPRTDGRLRFHRLRPALPSWYELVLGVADLADRCLAGRLDQPGLAGRQAERGHLALLGHDLDARPGRARHAGAATGLELHGVHRRTHGDVPQRQRLPAARRHPPPRPIGHRPADRWATGCSASRRRRSAGARSARCGWGRTRCAPPWLARRPCRAGSRSPGTGACCATELVPRGRPALRIAAGYESGLRDERALGLGARDLLSKEDTLAPRRPGVVGLYLRTAMRYFPASKISMLSPSASLTNLAPLWSARLPSV